MTSKYFATQRGRRNRLSRPEKRIKKNAKNKSRVVQTINPLHENRKDPEYFDTLLSPLMSITVDYRLPEPDYNYPDSDFRSTSKTSAGNENIECFESRYIRNSQDLFMAKLDGQRFTESLSRTHWFLDSKSIKNILSESFSGDLVEVMLQPSRRFIVGMEVSTDVCHRFSRSGWLVDRILCDIFRFTESGEDMQHMRVCPCGNDGDPSWPDDLVQLLPELMGSSLNVFKLNLPPFAKSVHRYYN